MTSQHQHRWIILAMFMIAHAVNDGLLWRKPVVIGGFILVALSILSLARIRALWIWKR